MATVERGIVLMNLGSPASTEVKDVKTYLNEFLMDERVIDYPYWLRALLVKGIIVPFRAPKSAKAYASIWTDQGSPLMVISEELREKVQEQTSAPVALAMRYGNPTPAMAYEALLQANPLLKEVILLPLYPHYAMSSYETAVEYAQLQYREGKYPFRLRTVPSYYDNETYLKALAESIQPYIANQDFDHLLFSYHGVPERHIKKGDITGCHCLKVENCCNTASPAHTWCYGHHCKVTTRRVAELLQLPPEKYSVSFQSRLGREEWLKPYTAKRLEEMPKEGIKKLLVVCPAFVSDCLETLEEIAEEGKEEFLHAGGESFTMIPCLNTQPQWISAIFTLLETAQDKTTVSLN